MKYYSIFRPVGIGTFPKYADNKVIEIVNFDYRKYVPEIGREAWGYIVYESEIAEAEKLMQRGFFKEIKRGHYDKKLV